MFNYKNEKQVKLDEKYPPNPPNDVCKFAYVEGILIENSFNPHIGEINSSFETEYEKLSIWTHEKDEKSAIIIAVDSTVKDIPFGKNICSIILMAAQYAKAFEKNSSEMLEYRWMYYFDQNKKLFEQVFNNIDQFDKIHLKSGSVIKATDISILAPEIELMIRDDKAYTAMMLLRNSFLQHNICLICECSKHPYHDHLSEEPEIWEHASIIPNMEAAIVQACRSVEGILGEPPNSTKKTAVLKHK